MGGSYEPGPARLGLSTSPPASQRGRSMSVQEPSKQSDVELVCASHSPLLYCYARKPERYDEIEDVFATRRAAIEAFDPELVVMFGSDHFNGFFLNMMPSLCIG